MTTVAGPGPAADRAGAPTPAGSASRCGADVPGLTRTTVAVGDGVVLHVAPGGPRAAPLPMPVTTVEGEAAGVPGISSLTVRALAPGLREVTVPGAGHVVQEDRPRETAAAIRAAGTRR